MSRMHEQIMKGISDIAGMPEMMESVAGMAKMYEQMMPARPAESDALRQVPENYGGLL